MTKSEENINSMFKAVSSLLAANQAKIDTLPALANSVSNFNQKLGDIQNKDAEYTHLTSGKTNMKNSAEEDMIEALLPIASAVNVYAKINGKADLKENSKVTVSDLRRLRDSELLIKAQYLHDIAQTNIADLANFGVAEANLTNLQSLIDTYKSSIEVKDTSFAEKSAARESLSKLFDDANEILKEEIDMLMELFRTSDSDFYNSYKSARVIRDL